MTIYKYPLRLTDLYRIEIPEGARLLSVQTQYGVPCIWALVDPDRVPTTRIFRIVGTGHPADDVAGARYCGTFQLDGGALVFHLFEIEINVNVSRAQAEPISSNEPQA